ncbi:MAG TPA: VOC family protein [Acidimicrobiales bacterium]|nr:VOC family protein [Acidimicrobiales bacterium]
MINAIHTLVHADDPVAAREFFRDVLSWPFVDDGDGWLIFKTGPSEMGVHPTYGDPGTHSATAHHEIALMCEDIEATMAELRSKGAEFRGDVVDRGFGLVAMLAVPGAGDVMLYQPKHQTAHGL